MRDIVGRGRDREPGPWPRRLAVVAAVLVAAGLIAVYLPRHAPGPVRHPAPAASSEDPAGAASAGSLSAVADGVAGQTLPWGSSARLPVSGQRPEWFWPATGRTAAIGGLPRDGAGYQFIRVGGGWAILPGPGSRRGLPGGLAAAPGGTAGGGCAGCADSPGPVWFLGDQARSASQIGLASRAAPGSAAGEIWLTSYPPGADPGTAAGRAQQVSVSGRQLGPVLRLPAGYAIVQATDRGLLLTPAAPGPGPSGDVLWNPAHPEASRTFANVLAASPGEIAWAPGCSPACQVQVLDLVTGAIRNVALPAGSFAASAAFSPDGQFLAIEAIFLETGGDGDQSAQLYWAPAASGQASAVPGSSVSSDALVGFGWSVAGDSLITELSFVTKVQVTSWSPGAPRLAVAAVPTGPDSAFLVAG